jgi:hypothetical protein
LTYDLAVREGERPADGESVGQIIEDFCRRDMQTEVDGIMRASLWRGRHTVRHDCSA